MSIQTTAVLTAIATLMMALVTAVYAFFTWRLWQETRRQANTTQGLSETTNRQADLMRQTFEASHRPYLALSTSTPTYEGVPPQGLQFRVPFVLENRGAVPAVVTRWSGEVRHGNGMLEHWDQKQPEIVLAVFPGVEHPLYVEVALLDRRTYFESGQPVVFAVAAEYAGLPGQSYSTRLVAELSLTQQAIRYSMREVAFT